MKKPNSNTPAQKNKPIRRSLICIALLIAIIYFLIVSSNLIEDLPYILNSPSLSNNLLLFFFVNTNIAIIMVLVFLVLRNLIKLFLDRKKKIVGSQIRSRMVASFIAVSFVPTALLFIVAKGIIDSAMQKWFTPQVASSVDGAIDIAQIHYQTIKSDLHRFALFLSQEASILYQLNLSSKHDHLLNSKSLREIIAHYIEKKLQEYDLEQIAIYSKSGQKILSSENTKINYTETSLPPPQLGFLHKASLGKTIVALESSMREGFVRSYSPMTKSGFSLTNNITFSNTSSGIKKEKKTTDILPTDTIIVTTLWINPILSSTLSRVQNNYEDFQELVIFRKPLASSYLLTLIGVTLTVIFAAIWLGFYLARSISGPFQDLARGTKQIAKGNLSYRIPEIGDDELGILIQSFNRMTGDLEEKTIELVSRRQYIEAILSEIDVGIVSTDKGLRIETINRKAEKILDIPKGSSQGTNLEQFFSKEMQKTVPELIKNLLDSKKKTTLVNFSTVLKGESRNLQVTCTKLVNEKEEAIGVIVLFNDVTNIVNSQRMKAWQEVARRIAHEIKNPLTPIQLGTQRIQKKLDQLVVLDPRKLKKGVDDIKKPILQSTDIILQQVDTMRKLVNEFSKFARMPQAAPQLDNLNNVISNTCETYKEITNDVEILLELADNLPEIRIDNTQIRQLLINLIDNAIDSVREASSKSSKIKPFIEISSKHIAQKGVVSLGIKDNGIGISAEDKEKVCQPYFSNKSGGTGLGLAIVNTIVADHRAYFRVFDNQPRGTIIRIEFPV